MSNNQNTDSSTPEDELQPLREVGSLEKTQYWDREDIMNALRVANLRGIRVESLYDFAHHPHKDTAPIEPKRAG